MNFYSYRLCHIVYNINISSEFREGNYYFSQIKILLLNFLASLIKFIILTPHASNQKGSNWRVIYISNRLCNGAK